MFRIRVERLINKDIDTVFALISDHENYQQFRGIDRSVLLTAGSQHKNGVGAFRHIVSGRFEIFERITAFKQPHRMDYHIERSRPLPIRHDKGEIVLSEESGATRATWISEGHVTIPLLGNWFLDSYIQKNVAVQFASIFKSIEQL